MLGRVAKKNGWISVAACNICHGEDPYKFTNLLVEHEDTSNTCGIKLTISHILLTFLIIGVTPKNLLTCIC